MGEANFYYFTCLKYIKQVARIINGFKNNFIDNRYGELRSKNPSPGSKEYPEKTADKKSTQNITATKSVNKLERLSKEKNPTKTVRHSIQTLIQLPSRGV